MNSLECNAEQFGIYPIDTKSNCRVDGHDLIADLGNYKFTECIREVNVWKETGKKTDTTDRKKIELKIQEL